MRLYLPIVLATLLCCGCASAPWITQRAGFENAPPIDPAPGQLADLAARMDRSHQLVLLVSADQRSRPGFLTPREQDFLEHSLADYLTCRHELIALAAHQHDADAQLSLATRQAQWQRDIKLVSLSVDDPVLWRAMNQSFHRSGIQRGSCDLILHELTASPAGALPEADRAKLAELIRRRAYLLPEVENQLWHAQPVAFLASSGQTLTSQLARGHNFVVTATGRIKNPVYSTITFTAAQREQIRASLRPGDILLTYTAGYASNLFVPGAFKHAATFVGTEAQRASLGFPAARLQQIAGPRAARLASTLAQPQTQTGEVADTVESVAEGVLLINFDKLLTTRINRLLVLRPHLSEPERAEQLVDVLSYVGDEFDFSFDLTDASDQVCTEVVYRSLEGRGGIDLTLVRIAGRLTLPPDEILRYAHQNPRQFEPVLLAEESDAAAGTAVIRSPTDTRARAAQLLGL